MDSTPRLLAPDNFTPAHRTPWGGRRILEVHKAALGLTDAGVVGESWELSVEPDFPSRLDSGVLLSEAIAADPVGWLGAAAARGNTALLVKLLDAADELSVQIHPTDDYPGLSEGEGGKPESWYVVSREPGAGLYLGLAEGVDRITMETCLGSSGDVSKLLTFVPVEPGDFFVIDAGTAHAIGRGVTLVEPQQVLPGRRGLTYRYWDWNRRYDAEGQRTPDGEPRDLHVDDALAVTAWDAPRGAALLSSIRHRGGPADTSGRARLETLGAPEGPAISNALWVGRLHGSGSAVLPASGFRAVTVLTGEVLVAGPEGPLLVPAGRSAALPASGSERRVELSAAHAIVSGVLTPP